MLPQPLYHAIAHGLVVVAASIRYQFASLAASMRPMKRRRVLVTGASGFVGSSVLCRLVDEGRDAVGLVRSGRLGAAAGLPVRVIGEWSEASLLQAVEGFDAVIHAASVVHRADASMSEYVRFNVDGTRALVEDCVAKHVERFVLFSTIKVYGELTQGVVDERTPIATESCYAHTKLDAEQIVLGAEPVRPVVFRLAPVFGVGDKGNVRNVIRAIARRRFLLPGDGATRKSLVHVSTVARVLSAALDSDTTGVFVLADRVAPSMRELSDDIAHAVGRRAPLSLPLPLMRAIALGLHSALGRRSPVSPS